MKTRKMLFLTLVVAACFMIPYGCGGGKTESSAPDDTTNVEPDDTQPDTAADTTAIEGDDDTDDGLDGNG